MKIENQNIYGGNQQFADLIINSNENKLSETDRKFIEVIHANTSSESERVEIINSLETIKTENIESPKRNESKSILKKFVDSSVNEAGKQIVKELIENGAKYLEGII